MAAEETLQAVLAVVCRVRTVAKDCAKMLGEDMPLLPKFLISEAPLCQATQKPASLRGDSLESGLRACVGNRVQGLQVEHPSQDSEQTAVHHLPRAQLTRSFQVIACPWSLSMRMGGRRCRAVRCGLPPPPPPTLYCCSGLDNGSTRVEVPQEVFA